jgi:hypothetical protein
VAVGKRRARRVVVRALRLLLRLPPVHHFDRACARHLQHCPDGERAWFMRVQLRPMPPSAARFCVSALPDARLATRQYNVSAAKEGLTDEPICGIVLPIVSVCTGTCAILSCIQVEQRAWLRGGGATCGLWSRVSHSVARHARAAMTRTNCA